MKIEYKLGRVHCAGCASALEELLTKVEGVNSVSLNFISNIVCLDVESKDHKQIEENIKKVIHKFDRNIEILDPYAEIKAEKKEKIKLIIRNSSIVLSLILMIVLSIFEFNKYLELGLYVFAYSIVAWRIILAAFESVFSGKVLDENFLMTIATIGAFALGEFTEAVAVILFYNIGEILQEKAVKNSERAIKKITEMKAMHATLILDNTQMDVTLDKVSIGDIIRVSPGEKVPLDGIVVSGEGYINMSALTGESQEKFIKTGETILSGSISSDAVLFIEVTTLERESTVSKIIALVEESALNKSKTEKFITRFAKWYTPLVVGLAAALAFIVPIFSLYSNFSVWAYRALMFLVVSCPCALVISVPLSFFAGIGACARVGVLVKGANYLEALSKVNTFIFDKTGTLTYGNFEVTKIVGFLDKPQDEILEFIAYAENFSTHRIAKSIVNKYKELSQKEINIAWINGVKEIAGEGVEANIFGIDCLVGNAKLMTDHGISIPSDDSLHTIIYLAQNGSLAGFVEVQDIPRLEAKALINELTNLGVNSIRMFTGDNKSAADATAKHLGINNYHYNLLPADKVEKLKELRINGSHLAFVGDGINDAPILSSVDVGVAMGGVGSDIAIESADVVIMDDNLLRIPAGVNIAKRTSAIVKQNIFLALFVKIAVMILSVIGLSNMWLAIFADVGVSLLAVLNATRALFTYKKSTKKLDKK